MLTLSRRAVIAFSIALILFNTAFSAATGPSVSLSTPSLGYPYTASFQVNVTFSEPVTGFSPTGVVITNGSLNGLTGSQAKYSLIIKPIKAGLISVSILANAAKSNSGEANTASDGYNVVGLDPSVNPSSNFNLSTWALTLPTPLGGVGDADEIDNDLLNADYTNSPYFYTSPSGSMIFFAPVNGATTPGTTFPRSELLENLPGANPKWTLNSYNTNQMTASLLVKMVPLSGRLVVGQIHDTGETDPNGNAVLTEPLLKIIYSSSTKAPDGKPCNGCLYAEIRPTPATAENHQIDNTLVSGIPLNTLLTYSITLQRNGNLQVSILGLAQIYTYTYHLNTSTNNKLGWGSQRFYFKAGAYVLKHGSSSTDGGEADFYYLKVVHE